MNAPLRVLIVEDSTADVDLLRRALRRGGYEVTSAVVDTPEAMRAALAQQDWDVITSDHAMPQFSAPAALALAKELCPDVPFIIVSGEIDLNLAVSLMREGAQDYIQKGELARLVPAIARELRDVEGHRERQRAEAVLREHEAHFRLLVEGVKDQAIFMLDPAGYIVRWHAGAECMQGYEPDAIIGQHFSRVYRPEDRAQQRPEHELEVAMAEGQVEAEGWRVGQDGSPFWAHVVITALRDEAGQLRGFVKVTRDVTERRRMEEQLRASETRYRRLFESARDGILILDAGTHTITDVNPFMVELLGYARDEFLGKALWEIGVLKDADASQEAFRTLQATGYIRYEDLPLQTKAGTRWDVEFVSNVYAENGHQVIQCNIRDITARKQAEAEIHRLNADLEQRVRNRTVQLDALNHDLEMFNASVSHDLHAPLRRIDSFVDALRDDYTERLDGEGLQFIQAIRAATHRMHELIDALLALSRVSRQELQWQVVDLSGLAHQIAAELHQRHPTRWVDWVIAEGLSTHGDARLLRIVLDNLLSNAWKFTATTAQARIELGEQTAPDGTSVWFVRDNGAGFDMALVDKLFGAFQRLHRDTEFPGTGIGLATVHRIIHRHGGRIWAEGSVNHGATFYFTLSGEEVSTDAGRAGTNC
jgi:PAS domain S-box-containing protein